MVVLDIYSKCLKIKYKTCLCSKVSFFIFLTTIISIIIPFIFAYNSRGFWIKHDTFYEQPNVKFNGEYLLTAVTTDINLPIVCNNFPFYQNFTSFDKCSLIKVREIDHNKDGKVDKIKFSVSIDQQDVKITSLSLILTLDYSFKNECPMKMQSAIIFQHQFNNFDTSEISVVSNLGLTQLSPLYCNPKYTNRQYNYSIIANKFDVEQYDVRNIISNYLKRNLTTHLTKEYTTFKLGTLDSELLLKLVVHIPEHKIYYSTSFWQVIKWAWIQYLAIYVVIAWIVRILKNYIFENNLLLFYEVNPFKKRQ